MFTAALGERDRRLRGQAVVWCVAHLPLVSARALNHAYTQQRWGADAMADFAATVQQLGGVEWPAAPVGHAFSVDASFEGWSAPFAERSQLALRLRSLLGVSVRAEVLRVLLTSTMSSHTYADLAHGALATKRQTTEAVEQLSWSGAVRIDRSRQPHHVRLGPRRGWDSLLGPLPEVSPDWSPLLRLLFVAVQALEDVAAEESDLVGAQLHRAVRQHQKEIARLGLEPPSPTPSGTYPSRAHDWFYELLHTAAHEPKHLVS